MKILSINRVIAKNKIARRNFANRKLIDFETQINPKYKKVLTEKLDELGKIARKNNREIGFQNGEGLFKDSTIINIYDRQLVEVDPMMLRYYNPVLVESHFLPENCSSNELVRYINHITKNAKRRDVNTANKTLSKQTNTNIKDKRFPFPG
ncbi:hypothetical protein IJO12_03435 [bacterium]|nr:hypothetical protein [bacterium]